MESLIVPCEYIEAKTMTQDRAFWVKLYLLIEPNGHVHSFFHSSEMIENMSFAAELGHKLYNTSLIVLCNSDFLPVLFRQIIDYENVLKSSGLAKPKPKYTFSKH